METKKCKECLGSFKTRFCKKFCSLSCSIKFKQEKWDTKKKFCLNCPKRIQDRDNQTFCTSDCRNKYTIQSWLDGKFNSTTKCNCVSQTIRKYLMEKCSYCCERCGWSGINPVSKKSTLHIEHIDGNRKNGYKNNLIVLCPNCHSLTPTWGALNIKK
mgnify:CR=1 FL=1